MIHGEAVVAVVRGGQHPQRGGVHSRRRRLLTAQALEETWAGVFAVDAAPSSAPVQACLSEIRATDVRDVVEPVRNPPATKVAFQRLTKEPAVMHQNGTSR